MRDEGLSGLSLFFSFSDNTNPSLVLPSSSHSFIQTLTETPIVLRENYNGERTKTFRLYVAGYEGVFRRGLHSRDWKLSLRLIPRKRIENRR